MAFGSLIHRHPVRSALSLRDPFEDLWSAPLFRNNAEPWASGFVPRIDAVEDENEFRVTAELPGLEEKDFEVVLEDGVLTLKGEKRSHTESEDEEKEGRRGVHRVESSWGRFERRLRFDAPIDEENVKASYKNGVLTVVVPKPPEAKPSVRTISVESA